MHGAFYLGHVLSVLEHERENTVFLEVSELLPNNGHLLESQSS